jgi:low-density lipoprotein receptor-related protein 4
VFAQTERILVQMPDRDQTEGWQSDGLRGVAGREFLKQSLAALILRIFPFQSYLLIALRSGIGRISLDTPEMFDVVLPIDLVYSAVVVDYHINKSLLFYADVNVDTIVRVNMTNWQQTETLVSSRLATPNGIAVDWLADNLYWTDTDYDKIEVSRLDGKSRKTILMHDMEDPRALILYPKKGYLFWADWGHHGRIERCLMDGSSRKVIVDSDIAFPTGLAIDFDTRKLYWADALQDRIEVSDFEGKKRSIVIAHAPHPFGFTLTATHFYWTDWYNKSVLRAPKRGNPSIQEIRHGMRGALEIRSVSQERQPLDWNPCHENNGGCTHLCLFLGSSYVCACPDQPDAVTCKAGTFSANKPPGTDDDAEPEDNHPKLPGGVAGLDDKASKHAKAFKIVQIAIITILILLVITTVVILGEFEVFRFWYFQEILNFSFSLKFCL